MEDMKETVGKTPTICFPSVTIVVPTCCRVGFARLDEANFDGAESGRLVAVEVDDVIVNERNRR